MILLLASNSLMHFLDFCVFNIYAGWNHHNIISNRRGHSLLNWSSIIWRGKAIKCHPVWQQSCYVWQMNFYYQLEQSAFVLRDSNELVLRLAQKNLTCKAFPLGGIFYERLWNSEVKFPRLPCSYSYHGKYSVWILTLIYL